jgi:hypothetical protein
MSDARFLDPHPTSTPTGAGAPDMALPDDLSEEAAGRLRIACLVFGTLWVIGLVVNHLVSPRLGLSADQMIPWPPFA